MADPDCNSPRKVPEPQVATPVDLTARLVQEGKARGLPACDMPRLPEGVTETPGTATGPMPVFMPFQSVIHHGPTVVIPPIPMGGSVSTPKAEEPEADETEEPEAEEPEAAPEADEEEDEQTNPEGR